MLGIRGVVLLSGKDLWIREGFPGHFHHRSFAQHKEVSTRIFVFTDITTKLVFVDIVKIRIASP